MNKTYCDKCNIEIDKTTDRAHVRSNSFSEVTPKDEYGGNYMNHKSYELDLCGECWSQALRFMTDNNVQLISYWYEL